MPSPQLIRAGTSKTCGYWISIPTERNKEGKRAKSASKRTENVTRCRLIAAGRRVGKVSGKRSTDHASAPMSSRFDNEVA